jgi:hypothetical protein
MRDTIVDVKTHFDNGYEDIISGRWKGEEERFLFYKEHEFKFGDTFSVYVQMTEEQERLYRKHNKL